MTLREQFEKETGTPWSNSQNEPDIEYVIWLEMKVESSPVCKECGEVIPKDDLLCQHCIWGHKRPNENHSL